MCSTTTTTAQENNSTNQNEQEQPRELRGGPRSSSTIQMRSYTMSTVALCLSVFCLEYMLFSPFSYSGFMAIALVGNGDRLTEETAGPYAGMIVSSFMVGRAFSSYPWGRLADRYGRRFVLIWSLVFSAFFSFCFGLAPTLPVAMLTRFLMGLGNGIMLVARTSVTELAKGDAEVEKQAMGHIMSMVGYAMLLSPAMGGTLSEPLKQYPQFFQQHDGESSFIGRIVQPFLKQFPFFLPNLIGAIIALISLVFVIISVEETLPTEQLRDPKYLLMDLMNCITTTLCSCCCRKNSDNNNQQNNSSIHSSNNSSSFTVTSLRNLLFPGLSFEEKTSTHSADEMSGLLSQASTPNASNRASYYTSPEEGQQEQPPINSQSNNHQNQQQEDGKATVVSILSKKSARDHLLCYWIYAFYSVASNEAFPLFAMSKTGGLGWKETRIGGIGTAAGLIYVLLQYTVFTKLMHHYSVHEGLRISSFLANVPVVLIPVSLLLQQLPSSGNLVGTGDQWSFIFLCVLYGVIVVFSAIFYACITITTNRTVDAKHRATMNGLSSLGSSIGRGIGPLVAGTLVAFSFSDTIIPPTLGSFLLYGIFALMGLISFWTTLHLKEEDEEQQQQEGNTDV